MIIFLKATYRFNIIPTENSNGILCRTRKKILKLTLYNKDPKQLKQLWTEKKVMLETSQYLILNYIAELQ